MNGVVLTQLGVRDQWSADHFVFKGTPVIKKMLSFLVLLGGFAASLSAETVQVGVYQLDLSKGFQVLDPDEQGRVQVRTPAWHPISVVALSLGPSTNWESVALEYLLAEYRRADAKILPTDRPQEISIKREGAWTTIYWTYGGTRAYFGMYWGGQTLGDDALLFWANPLKASGRPQYQALSEVTKGVKVIRS